MASRHRSRRRFSDCVGSRSRIVQYSGVGDRAL